MKRILFVDDEPKVLEGLRRMLRPLHRQWEMVFVPSGQEALERLGESSFDVIVSDMRMPSMDGAQLLQEVARRHPATVRIVLSGQCDRETVLQSVGPTHQFLTKPCDSEVLKSTVGRLCELRDRLIEPQRLELASGACSVPSAPWNHRELLAELELPKPSLKTIGRIVAEDPGMAGRVIQLVSSSFLGRPQRVSCPRQAVSLLGIETLKALAVQFDRITPFDSSGPSGPYMERLVRHGVACARLAEAITEAEQQEPQMVQDAYLAGLLHDIGLLVLAEEFSAQCLENLEVSNREGISVWEAERRTIGTTHADVGGYLLGLWGLPDPIIEAVTMHHCPSRTACDEFTALTAVHVANAMLAEDLRGQACNGLDQDYLARLGLADRVDVWRQLEPFASLQGVPA